MEPIHVLHAPDALAALDGRNQHQLPARELLAGLRHASRQHEVRAAPGEVLQLLQLVERFAQRAPARTGSHGRPDRGEHESHPRSPQRRRVHLIDEAFRVRTREQSLPRLALEEGAERRAHGDVDVQIGPEYLGRQGGGRFLRGLPENGAAQASQQHEQGGPYGEGRGAGRQADHEVGHAPDAHGGAQRAQGTPWRGAAKGGLKSLEERPVTPR
jgi:hypothetical protein